MENLLPENIQLVNRDGVWMALIKKENEDYYYFNANNKFYFDYWSIHTDPKNSEHILAVDPPGGPFMAEGEYIEGSNCILDKIEWEKGVGFKFYLKNGEYKV